MNKIVRRIYEDRAIKRALVKEFERTGQGVTLQAINSWRKLKDGVPAKRVQTVAKIMGLPPHMIRPDVFPRP
jgi:hypothetical protein